MKDDDFHKWKAIQFRSNWRRRAKLVGANLEELPSLKEITAWLNEQSPFKCFFTGQELQREFGVDHIVPVARSGSFKLDNLCITHPFINGAKGAMTGEEFIQLLELISTWEDQGKDILRRLRSSNTMFGGKK